MKKPQPKHNEVIMVCDHKKPEAHWYKSEPPLTLQLWSEGMKAKVWDTSRWAALCPSCAMSVSFSADKRSFVPFVKSFKIFKGHHALNWLKDN